MSGRISSALLVSHRPWLGPPHPSRYIQVYGGVCGYACSSHAYHITRSISVCLLAYLSIHLSIYLSIHPSTTSNPRPHPPPQAIPLCHTSTTTTSHPAIAIKYPTKPTHPVFPPNSTSPLRFPFLSQLSSARKTRGDGTRRDRCRRGGEARRGGRFWHLKWFDLV